MGIKIYNEKGKKGDFSVDKGKSTSLDYSLSTQKSFNRESHEYNNINIPKYVHYRSFQLTKSIYYIQIRYINNY